ncbi:hypothetical protein FKP32DRAFT_1686970 [Trametes sanguinea]|nr:hypothetical protein FKP32DRAFT_1686970 [Trametes sanguinea]
MALTPSSAHQALANLDILTEIVSWFEFRCFHRLKPHVRTDWVLEDMDSVFESSRERWKGILEAERVRTLTLAHLARVCKTFREPSLRMLWRQLRGIFPLLRLLPSLIMVQDLMGWFGGQESQFVYHLPAHMLPGEWARLSSYAIYVRELYHVRPVPIRPGNITEQTWTLLLRAFGNRPLLPNLQVLKWDAEEAHTELAALDILLCPSLEQLSIKCTTPSSMCAHVARDPDAMIQLLSLSHPQSLRELCSSACESRHIHLQSLKALPRFTTIKSLGLCLTIADIPQADLPPKLELDNLESLSLYSLPAHGVGLNPAYDVFASTNLRTLDIWRVQYISDAALQRMSSAWARSFPCLEVFECSIGFPAMQDSDSDSETEPPLPSPAPLTSLLEPLLDLRRMREVIVGFYVSPVVSDHDLTVFAQAWPSLEKLHLGWGTDDSPSSGPGLLGLLALSIGCPKLVSLELAEFTFCAEDAAQLPPEPPSPHHALRKLQVTNGMSPDAYNLVRHKIFPNLPS